MIETNRALGITGNKNNGISPRNPKGPSYRQAAADEFPELAGMKDVAESKVPEEFLPEFFDVFFF